MPIDRVFLMEKDVVVCYVGKGVNFRAISLGLRMRCSFSIQNFSTALPVGHVSVMQLGMRPVEVFPYSKLMAELVILPLISLATYRSL